MRWWCVVCVVWLCPLSYFGCLCGPAQTEKQSFNLLLHVLYLNPTCPVSRIVRVSRPTLIEYSLRLLPGPSIDRPTARERGEKSKSHSCFRPPPLRTVGQLRSGRRRKARKHERELDRDACSPDVTEKMARANRARADVLVSKSSCHKLRSQGISAKKNGNEVAQISFIAGETRPIVDMMG